VSGRFQGSIVGEREVVSGVEFNRKGLMEEKLEEESQPGPTSQYMLSSIVWRGLILSCLRYVPLRQSA